MPSFAHEGIQFYYRDEGTGRPFIFQHGLGGDSSQPFGLFKPPAGIRLIAFDARTHGQTQPTGDPLKLGFETFAGDLQALLDHLAIAQAVIGGISMGAGIALKFALRHPGRLLGLVLSRPAWLDAPCPWNVQMFGLITSLIRKHGRFQGKERFLQTEDYLEAKQKWPDVANSMAGHFDNPQVEDTAFKFDRIINDTPNRDRGEWGTIRVPTLVLANRQDPVHPYGFGETLAAAIPHAKLREITSKSVSVERHTAEVQQYLEEFLTSLSDQSD